MPVFINPALSTLHGNAAAFITLCFNKTGQHWTLENIKGYSLANGQRYNTFPNELCLGHSISTCLAMFVKSPGKLLDYVKQNYFAANSNQTSKLKTKSQYLIN